MVISPWGLEFVVEALGLLCGEARIGERVRVHDALARFR